MKMMRSVLLITLFCMGLASSLPFATSAIAQPKKAAQTGKISQTATTFKNWGQSIDPDQDSQFIFGRNNLSIVVNSGDHALAIERRQMNAPRLLRNVSGDFSLQVRMSGNYPQNATTKVPGRPPFHGAGILLWQDKNNYIRLERASVAARGGLHNYISFEKREAGEFNFGTSERQTKPIKLANAAQGISLRMVRRQDQVMAFYSVDGKQWQSVGTFEARWATGLQAGFVAGHNTNKGYSPTFEQLVFSL
jgi:regulation of enolase protein 1 (concanavalin A-like superfamily)